MAGLPWKVRVKSLQKQVVGVTGSLLLGYFINDVSNKMQRFGYRLKAFIPYMVMLAILFAMYMARFIVENLSDVSEWTMAKVTCWCLSWCRKLMNRGEEVLPRHQNTSSNLTVGNSGPESSSSPRHQHTPTHEPSPFSTRHNRSKDITVGSSGRSTPDVGCESSSLPCHHASQCHINGEIHSTQIPQKCVPLGREKRDERSTKKSVEGSPGLSAKSIEDKGKGKIIEDSSMIELLYPNHLPNGSAGTSAGSDDGGQLVITEETRETNFSSTDVSGKKESGCTKRTDGGPSVSSPSASMMEINFEALSDSSDPLVIKVTIPKELRQDLRVLKVIFGFESGNEIKAELMRRLDCKKAFPGSIILHKEVAPSDLLKYINIARQFKDNCTIQVGSVTLFRKTDGDITCWKVQNHWTPTILSIRRHPRKLFDFLTGEAPEWCVTGFNLQNTTLTAVTTERKETVNVYLSETKTAGTNVLVFKEPLLCSMFGVKVYIYASNDVEVEGETFKVYSEAKEIQQAYWISVIDGFIPSPWSVIKMTGLSVLGGSIHAWTTHIKTRPETFLVSYCITGLLLIVSTYLYFTQGNSFSKGPQSHDPAAAGSRVGGGGQVYVRPPSESSAGGPDPAQQQQAQNDRGRAASTSSVPTENGEAEQRVETEWVEQDEPGVYITLTALPGGGKDLKRVRFSRKRFSERQAEQWWVDNRQRVHEQYNVRGLDKQNSGVTDPSSRPAGEEETKLESVKFQKERDELENFKKDLENTFAEEKETLKRSLEGGTAGSNLKSIKFQKERDELENFKKDLENTFAEEKEILERRLEGGTVGSKFESRIVHMASHGMLEPARVIVAIDFGTTYSGFSYAPVPVHFAEKDFQKFLETVAGYDRWPSQGKAGAKPYYKTQTSLLYMQKRASNDAEYELKAWGWSASVEHAELLKKCGNSNRLDGKQFHFITKFKLALAGSNVYGNWYTLPKGFTAERVIADYLHELSTIVEKELQEKFGPHLTKRNIQWCLTVPAMCEDAAKQQMIKCAERAGLVSGPSNAHGGGSTHPVIIGLEPEAASANLHYLNAFHQIPLAAESKILIVDAGGAIVDLVLLEKVNSWPDCSRVSGFSGALCGSTFVDDEFYKLLSRKIPCYMKFISENPLAVFKIQREWEEIKFSFEGDVGSEFWLPAKLSRYWEAYSKENGLHRPDSTYDDVEISLKEITAVFDSQVDVILGLIKQQLSQVAGKDVDVLMVVGGFANSFYLRDKIRTTFESKAMLVITPRDPGEAMLTGAVAFGCLGLGFRVRK